MHKDLSFISQMTLVVVLHAFDSGAGELYKGQTASSEYTQNGVRLC